MRYLSLFSGIEAATSAWHPLGWECVGVAEIEPFPSKVLRHHYPNVRNLGDVTKLTEMDIADLGPIDVVVFGSPCQDLSVAGKRKGLAGARSGLFFTAMQIITWSRLWCGTRFALWENVPGAFSSNKGADFAAVVDELSGLAGTEPPPKGWGTEGCTAGPEAMVEWSTLDAQWFGVAQRRRRVFALADFGNWAGRQPILLEPQSMRGDSAPSRASGQVAPTIPARSLGGGGLGTDFDCDGGVIQAFGGNNQSGPIDVATARSACASATGRLDFESETFLVQQAQAVAVALRGREGGATCEVGDEVGFSLRASSGGGDKPHVLTAMQVRRITPRECERLQGFPDDYTLLPLGKELRFGVQGGVSVQDDEGVWHHFKPAPDGPRYKALGNSMAVPVMRCIGRRIDLALLFQE